MTNATNFLLENICIKFGDVIYRQVVGIPMGTNFAPLMADLFLYCLNPSLWSNSKRSFSIWLNRKMRHHLYRYLNNIFAVNNLDFLKCHYNIPQRTYFKKRLSGQQQLFFSGFKCFCSKRKIKTKIYDKREDFSLPIRKLSLFRRGSSFWILHTV